MDLYGFVLNCVETVRGGMHEHMFDHFHAICLVDASKCHVSSGATDDPMEIGGMPTDAPKKTRTGSKTDWVI